MTDIFRLYGITEEEVLEWGKKYYPMFLGAKNILASLYLREVKGINVDPSKFQTLTGPYKKIKELRPNEWCVIEVVVGPRLKQNFYQGCPECFKKVSEEGICESCGKVSPQTMCFESYVVGDNTGDIVVDLPPRVTAILRGREITGSIARFRGVMREDGEFMAQAIDIVEFPKASPSAPAPSAPAPTPSTPQLPQLPQPAPSQPAPSQPVVQPTQNQVQPQPVQVVNEIIAKETELLKKVLTVFSNVSLEDLEMWHKSRKLQTPLHELIKAAGAVVTSDNKVVLK
jgi:hypothetical protein